MKIFLNLCINMMQEISVIWVDRPLQWAKGCRTETQLEFSKQGCYYSWCSRKRPIMSIFIYLKSAFFCLPHTSVSFVGVSDFDLVFQFIRVSEISWEPLQLHSLQADERCLPCHLLSSGLYFCIGVAVIFSATSQDHSVIAECWLKHPANSASFRVSQGLALELLD